MTGIALMRFYDYFKFDTFFLTHTLRIQILASLAGVGRTGWQVHSFNLYVTLKVFMKQKSKCYFLLTLMTKFVQTSMMTNLGPIMDILLVLWKLLPLHYILFVIWLFKMGKKLGTTGQYLLNPRVIFSFWIRRLLLVIVGQRANLAGDPQVSKLLCYSSCTYFPGSFFFNHSIHVFKTSKSLAEIILLSRLNSVLYSAMTWQHGRIGGSGGWCQIFGNNDTIHNNISFVKATSSLNKPIRCVKDIHTFLWWGGPGSKLLRQSLCESNGKFNPLDPKKYTLCTRRINTLS